ncbi:MAG: hypothetical protein AAB642_03575 [Patescibacteria group bacterium]
MASKISARGFVIIGTIAIGTATVGFSNSLVPLLLGEGFWKFLIDFVLFAAGIAWMRHGLSRFTAGEK